MKPGRSHWKILNYWWTFRLTIQCNKEGILYHHFSPKPLDVFGRHLISFLKHREYGIQKNLDISISQNSVEKNLLFWRWAWQKMREGKRGRVRVDMKVLCSNSSPPCKVHEKFGVLLFLLKTCVETRLWDSNCHGTQQKVCIGASIYGAHSKGEAVSPTAIALGGWQ